MNSIKSVSHNRRPRFSGISEFYGQSAKIKDELRAMRAGGLECLWAFQEETLQTEAIAVLLTARDIDRFWQLQPGCGLPRFFNHPEDGRVSKLLQSLSPPRFIRYIKRLAQANRNRMRFLADAQKVRHAVFEYANRYQETDIEGQPVQHYLFY